MIMDWIRKRQKRRQRQKRRRPCGHGGRTWSGAATSLGNQEVSQPPGAGRGKDRFSLVAPDPPADTLVSDF